MDKPVKLMEAAKGGHRALVGFLMDRASTEDDAHDFLALLARVGELEGVLATVDRQVFCDCSVEHGGDHEFGCYVPMLRQALQHSSRSPPSLGVGEEEG